MWKFRKRPSWQCCVYRRIDITIPSPKKPKNWQSLLPGLVVSAASLVILYYLVDGQKVLNALRMADYRLVLVCWALSILWLTVRAAFWRTLLQERASFKQVFLTLNQGYLLNNLLPFRLGELGRAFLLSRKAGLKFWEIISTIFLERALDVIVAVSLFLSAIPFVIGAQWAVQAAITTGGIVVAGLVGLYLLARYRQQVEAFLTSLSNRRPWIGRLAQSRLPAFLNGLAILTNSRRFLMSIGWCLINWLISVLSYFVFLAAFFPKPTMLWAVFGLSASALGIAAPSSPGALGVYEVVTVWAFSFFITDASRTLAFAMVAHASNYLITGVIGGVALYRDGESLLSLYQQTRSLK
jgi:hypothetical protein